MHGAQVWHEISCTYQNHVGMQEDCHRPVLTGLLLREREKKTRRSMSFRITPEC